MPRIETNLITQTFNVLRTARAHQLIAWGHTKDDAVLFARWEAKQRKTLFTNVNSESAFLAELDCWRDGAGNFRWDLDASVPYLPTDFRELL